MLKRKKEKAPINKDKLLTRLAILTTVVLTIVVSFFSIYEQFKTEKQNYENSIKILNSLNNEYNTKDFIFNKITQQDFESLVLKSKPENAGWPLFENNAFNAEKYDNLNSVKGDLKLTDRECGYLINGLLNVTENNKISANFEEVSFKSTQTPNEFNLRFVFSFNIKTLLSIDVASEEVLKTLKINLPSFVYAINTCVFNTQTHEIKNNEIKYNSLNVEQSKSVTALLNVGKTNEENSFETFACRMLTAINDELNSKTNTFTQFVNGGINYLKNAEV